MGRISALTELSTLASNDYFVVLDTSANIAKKISKANLESSIVPSGTTVPYAGTTAPDGWLFAYGQAVSRSTYAALFTAIGTTYGSGDGSTTFNVPDLRGRVVAGQDDMGGSSANRLTGLSGGLNGDTLGATGGAESHTLITAEIPAHSHPYDAISLDTSANGSARPNVKDTAADRFPATNNTGGGGAHNNVQPTVILNYIIKT